MLYGARLEMADGDPWALMPIRWAPKACKNSSSPPYFQIVADRVGEWCREFPKQYTEAQARVGTQRPIISASRPEESSTSTIEASTNWWTIATMWSLRGL
jgi:hypothetical protein